MTANDREDPFYCTLNEHSLIAVNGTDARAFLHRQVTCDIEGLPSAASSYGGFCSPKGRLFATFLVWRTANGLMLQLPRLLCEPMQAQLSKYVLRAKVHISDQSDAFVRFGMHGARSVETLEKMFGPLPGGVHTVAHPQDATILTFPGERIEIIVPAEKSSTLSAALRNAACEKTARVWDLMDIQAGIPNILPPTREAFVPQMVNLDLIGGISYSKGCYPGQEIVARMHYLGRLKSRAYLAHLDGTDEPQPGDSLYSVDHGSQATGTIVNVAPVPTGGYDLLAVIQIASANSTRIRWRTPEGPALTLRALPYSVEEHAT